MIEIAIWGIAFMLIVKGVDILHQQRLAETSGNKGSPIVGFVGVVRCRCPAACRSELEPRA